MSVVIRLLPSSLFSVRKERETLWLKTKWTLIEEFFHGDGMEDVFDFVKIESEHTRKRLHFQLSGLESSEDMRIVYYNCIDTTPLDEGLKRAFMSIEWDK